MRALLVALAVVVVAVAAGDDDVAPTPAAECALIPDPGTCKGFFRRFYYDRWAGRCAMFIYGGCKGVVPFRLHQECEDAKCYLMFPRVDAQNAFYARRAAAPVDGGDFHTVSFFARTTLL